MGVGGKRRNVFWKSHEGNGRKSEITDCQSCPQRHDHLRGKGIPRKQSMAPTKEHHLLFSLTQLTHTSAHHWPCSVGSIVPSRAFSCTHKWHPAGEVPTLLWLDQAESFQRAGWESAMTDRTHWTCHRRASECTRTGPKTVLPRLTQPLLSISQKNLRQPRWRGCQGQVSLEMDLKGFSIFFTSWEILIPKSAFHSEFYTPSTLTLIFMYWNTQKRGR